MVEGESSIEIECVLEFGEVEGVGINFSRGDGCSQGRGDGDGTRAFGNGDTGTVGKRREGIASAIPDEEGTVSCCGTIDAGTTSDGGEELF